MKADDFFNISGTLGTYVIHCKTLLIRKNNIAKSTEEGANVLFLHLFAYFDALISVHILFLMLSGIGCSL